MPSGFGPLFETRTDRVVGSLPKDSSLLLKEFTEEPLRSAPSLREDIRAYVEELAALRADAEFLDYDLACRLAKQCEALLDSYRPEAPEEARRLIQAAIRYFIEDEDAEGDTASPIGFDDDAEVVAAVARELGREDVLKL